MSDLRNAAVEQFVSLTLPPGTRISDNFSLWELTKSETASRLCIDNSFRSIADLQNAVNLTRKVLQPARERFGRYSPNSVYRCQELERALKNKQLPWVSQSQHTRGQAADIEVHGASNLRLAQWIASKLEFDQVILECYDPAQGPNSGWVHVSLKPDGNRGEVLSYIKRNGAYVYVPGLVED